MCKPNESTGAHIRGLVGIRISTRRDRPTPDRGSPIKAGWQLRYWTGLHGHGTAPLKLGKILNPSVLVLERTSCWPMGLEQLSSLGNRLDGIGWGFGG